MTTATEVLAWFVGVAANVYALAALVIGLRARDPAVLSRYARRCAWSVLAFMAAYAPIVAVIYELSRRAYDYRSPIGDLRAEKSLRYGAMFAVQTNALVFLLAVALPLFAAAVLFYMRMLRAREAAR